MTTNPQDISGNCPARNHILFGGLTGSIAAKAAEHIFSSPYPPGVIHIEELFDPFDLFRCRSRDECEVRF